MRTRGREFRYKAVHSTPGSAQNTAAKVHGAYVQAHHDDIATTVHCNAVDLLRVHSAKSLGPLVSPCSRVLGHEYVVSPSTYPGPADTVCRVVKVSGHNNVTV